MKKKNQACSKNRMRAFRGNSKNNTKMSLKYAIILAIFLGNIISMLDINSLIFTEKTLVIPRNFNGNASPKDSESGFVSLYLNLTKDEEFQVNETLKVEYLIFSDIDRVAFNLFINGNQTNFGIITEFPRILISTLTFKLPGEYEIKLTIREVFLNNSINKNDILAQETRNIKVLPKEQDEDNTQRQDLILFVSIGIFIATVLAAFQGMFRRTKFSKANRKFLNNLIATENLNLNTKKLFDANIFLSPKGINYVLKELQNPSKDFIVDINELSDEEFMANFRIRLIR